MMRPGLETDDPEGYEDSARILDTALDSLDHDLSALSRIQLLNFAGMVVEWGKSTNLSGHQDVRSVVGKLVVGSLCLLDEILRLPGQAEGECRTATDLGSGAGFPGIPIAISMPTVEMLLVDSRERRHHFQRAARRRLAINNIEPRLGRIEALAPTPASFVVAQAVAAPAQVLEWGSRWVADRGFLIIPGGPQPPDPGPPDPQVFPESGTVTYRVPGAPGDSSLWWGRCG